MEKWNNYQEFINDFAKALTHIIFRNGSIENMHADSSKNILDSDMKILNKEIHNRIYTLLLLMYNKDEELMQDAIIGRSSMFNPFVFGKEWDKAEIDKSILMGEDFYGELKSIENKFKNIQYYIKSYKE